MNSWATGIFQNDVIKGWAKYLSPCEAVHKDVSIVRIETFCNTGVPAELQDLIVPLLNYFGFSVCN